MNKLPTHVKFTNNIYQVSLSNSSNLYYRYRERINFGRVMEAKLRGMFKVTKRESETFLSAWRGETVAPHTL
jgi:hypothetical protein